MSTVLLIALYPVVPLAAYLNLLWHRPKDISRARKETNNKETATFREAEHLAVVAHSIAGGIESPVQFILQVRFYISFNKKKKPFRLCLDS